MKKKGAQPGNKNALKHGGYTQKMHYITREMLILIYYLSRKNKKYSFRKKTK